MSGFESKRKMRSETGTIKVVINADYGGFSLSGEAYAVIAKVNGWTRCTNDYGQDYLLDDKGNKLFYWNIPRDNSGLVTAVETLGSEDAGGEHSTLKIVEVPDSVNWYVEEYDGKEWVAERHRTWK